MSFRSPPLARFAGLCALGALPALAASCRSPTGADAGSRFGVRAEHRGEGVLVLTNRTSDPVFRIAFGARTAPLVLWGACVDAASCPTIAPGARAEVRVDLTAADGGRETEAIVYWWRAVRGPDGTLRPDEIRTLVVRL